jgi:hypothetical protein
MDVIGRLIERLQRWFARYRTEVTYAEAIDRRRQSLAEIEWNGATIGDVRRRSRDAWHLRKALNVDVPKPASLNYFACERKNGSWLMSLS